MKTWRERVAEARERGKFTEVDRIQAYRWASCAVGEQHRLYPLIVRYEWDEPRDGQLYTLGLGGSTRKGFAFAVDENLFDLADQRLDQIEDRVLQLKREYTDGGLSQEGDA